MEFTGSAAWKFCRSGSVAGCSVIGLFTAVRWIDAGVRKTGTKARYYACVFEMNDGLQLLLLHSCKRFQNRLLRANKTSAAYINFVHMTSETKHYAAIALC
jgi:hypothetical protein